MHQFLRCMVKEGNALPEIQSVRALIFINITIWTDYNHLRHIFKIIQILKNHICFFIMPGPMASAVPMKQVKHRIFLVLTVIRR